MNGPFLPPDDVRHGSLSILPAPDCAGFAAVEVLPGWVGGFGRIGLSLVVVPVEVEDGGDDLDELVDRGEGSVTGGDEIWVEMVECG